MDAEPLVLLIDLTQGLEREHDTFDGESGQTEENEPEDFGRGGGGRSRGTFTAATLIGGLGLQFVVP